MKNDCVCFLRPAGEGEEKRPAAPQPRLGQRHTWKEAGPSHNAVPFTLGDGQPSWRRPGQALARASGAGRCGSRETPASDGNAHVPGDADARANAHQPAQPQSGRLRREGGTHGDAHQRREWALRRAGLPGGGGGWGRGRGLHSGVCARDPGRAGDGPTDVPSRAPAPVPAPALSSLSLLGLLG